jgi:glycosyltransferase involved in cell wall biosynthesis
LDVLNGPPRTSAIVPVFNEQQTVGAVVDTLLSSSLIDEVVCVNDGSTDQSLAILRRFGDRIVLVDLQSNRGKGYALAEGIRRSTGHCLAFFDADLLNLSSEHIAALLAPIWTGSARAVLGGFDGDAVFSLASALTPGVTESVGSTFSGERAYLRDDLLPHLSRMETSRFGVEVYLNDAFSQADTAVVTLRGLTGLWKPRKRGWLRAVKEYAGEGLEVVRELVRTRLARLDAGRAP